MTGTKALRPLPIRYATLLYHAFADDRFLSQFPLLFIGISFHQFLVNGAVEFDLRVVTLTWRRAAV